MFASAPPPPKRQTRTLASGRTEACVLTQNVEIEIREAAIRLKAEKGALKQTIKILDEVIFDEEDDEAECVSADPTVATEQAKDARAACRRHADAARLSAEAAQASAATANEREAQRAESAPASSQAPPVTPAADPVTLPMALDPRALTSLAAYVGHIQGLGGAP
mmetsp:Transcript_2043/g.5094  ORF Transcript_2043/g.5094 Transcript_2043/m.5094 type:complete len:165 (+) Transcript_2043:454-948(+)